VAPRDASLMVHMTGFGSPKHYGGDLASTGMMKDSWRDRRPRHGVNTLGKRQLPTITASLSRP